MTFIIFIFDFDKYIRGFFLLVLLSEYRCTNHDVCGRSMHSGNLLSFYVLSW